MPRNVLQASDGSLKAIDFAYYGKIKSQEELAVWLDTVRSKVELNS